MLTADSPHEVMSEIVAITEWAGNEDRLIWDVMKVSHHCSYKSLGPKKGTLSNNAHDRDKASL